MRKTAITKNRILILLVTALLAVVSVFALFALRGGAAVTVAAEGNEAVSPTGTPEVDLMLDVNGKYASTITGGVDSTYDNIGANNSKYYGERVINAQAVIQAYNDKHSTALNPSAYYFVKSGIAEGYDSVRLDSSKFVVSVRDSAQDIVVTAKAATRSEGEFFSVKLATRRSNGAGGYNTDTFITVYFRVVILNTFRQFEGRTSGEILLVGNNKTDAGSAETDKTKVPVHQPITVFDNYSTITINLGDFLKDRILYTNDDGSNDYVTPITMDGVAGSNKFWGVKSVENFTIRNITFGTGEAIKNVIYTDDTAHGIDPTVTASLNISSSEIKNIAEAHNSSLTTADAQASWFWDVNTVHRLELRLGLRNDPNVTYRIYIPVRFRPANPQRKNIIKKQYELNILSPYTRDIKSGKYIDSDGAEVPAVEAAESGYSSVIIRPSDLVDYSAPLSYAEGKDHSVLTFDALRTSGFGLDVDNPNTNVKSYENDYYKIEKIVDTRPDGTPYKDEETTSYPDAYKITAKANSFSNITLGVSYFTESGNRCAAADDVLISVPINGYGNYKIVIPDVNNKKGVSYNVLTSDMFGEVLDAGFQMSSAESLNSEQLSVQFKDNMLILTPLVDRIDGQTTAKVRMKFTNASSQSITIESNVFAVNIKAKDFFSLFDADWKAWLTIAAIVLGGILIVLLVVWLFIHSISKHKQDEAAAQAPVSSYIVRLNSTIAATQAQQRLATTQVLPQTVNQMLLDVGTTSTAAPNTLQLALGTDEITTQADGASSEPRMSEPKDTADGETDEALYAKIAEYISDEDLLERIFTDKYEPKGMVRRTFFKSKDLQARELDKEKKRIIERYKTPMPMVEAIMSEAEIKNAEKNGEIRENDAEVTDGDVQIYVLNFDPDSPLYTPEPEITDEFSEEKIDIDVSPEESRLRELEKAYGILSAELDELKSRLDNASDQSNSVTSHADELRERISKAEADNAGFAKDIEDLEFKLASAKQKDKDKITRDIKIKEEKIVNNNSDIEKWKAELDLYISGGDTLADILSRLTALQEQKSGEHNELSAELEKAKADYDAYIARLEQVKARQELDAKVEGLSPILVAVNTADYEIKKLRKVVDAMNKERDDVKSAVAAAKAQILGANDFEIINDLNQRIADGNARLSDIEKDIMKSTKQNSELNIEFNSQRNKANKYVEENDIPLDEVIKAEDKVIGDIEFNAFKLVAEKDRDEAEHAVATAQAAFDDVLATADDVTMLSIEIAASIKDLEDELASTQAELDEISTKMEASETEDDEKLMLMVDQGDKADKLEELKEKVKQANVDGTKRKMEIQAEHDEKLEVARRELDEANEQFRKASEKFDSLINDTDPLDLIVSGSGVISQDQKKREQENLKKQLEKSKNEIEQARLAAQMAQEEAEQARINADLATAAAKEELERKAQEAIEQAEAARLEAEEKARLEAEAAEQARKDAEEAVKQARKDADEASEQARKDADEASEQARKEAEEAAEQARKEAEEAAEQARKEAEEAIIAEAEETKRKAQEEVEALRRKSEEEAEQRRIDEENRLKEEEERKKAEQERRDALAKKIAARKEQVLSYRTKMKEIKSDEDAKQLREELYTTQLGFDEEERASTELMDFYNKTMDDIQNAGEIATLKAENAKKPQRVVRKVTERVNRIARKKPNPNRKKTAGSRSARPGAARPRPAGARPRPGAARPRPAGARPRPGAARPGAARPRPSGSRPGGTRPPTGRS